MNGSKLYLFLFLLIGNYFFTLLIIGLAAAWISLLRKPKPLKINTVAEAFLSHYMLFPIGISNLINFVFHVFFGDTAAKFIGWDNSPFQAEVGFASLGIGIAGVLAYKASLPFRVATFIPPAAFSLGAAGGHIYQMIAAHNFSPGNVGLVLPSDILIPVVGFTFLWLSYKHPKSEVANQKVINQDARRNAHTGVVAASLCRALRCCCPWEHGGTGPWLQPRALIRYSVKNSRQFA